MTKRCWLGFVYPEIKLISPKKQQSMYYCFSSLTQLKSQPMREEIFKKMEIAWHLLYLKLKDICCSTLWSFSKKDNGHKIRNLISPVHFSWCNCKPQKKGVTKSNIIKSVHHITEEKKNYTWTVNIEQRTCS